MGKITKLLDTLNRLCDTEENKRRQSLWLESECPIRGETQWHGIPGVGARPGAAMPVTAECLNTLWLEILGFRLDRYYRDPEYYLEHYLRMKIEKFTEFPDDTPIDRNIPIGFGVVFEAGILGQKYYLSPDEEPAFVADPVIKKASDFPAVFDFDSIEIIKTAQRFHNVIRNIAGKEFNVIFPVWFRGPQGVALYIRGFENFLIDLTDNPGFVHRTMRYVTDAQKAFITWRARYLEEPVYKVDLFNDDIPIMSPESYTEFVYPYERELCDLYGGIYYWHSCGDITRHIPDINRLGDIDLLDFGVSMDDKGAGLSALNRSLNIEMRVLAHRYIQNAADDEIEAYMRDIVVSCRERNIEKYVLRTSGMSLLLGAREDLKRLVRWVELTRKVQGELS